MSVAACPVKPSSSGLDDLGQLAARDGTEDLRSGGDELLDVGDDGGVGDGGAVGQLGHAPAAAAPVSDFGTVSSTNWSPRMVVRSMAACTLAGTRTPLSKARVTLALLPLSAMEVTEPTGTSASCTWAPLARSPTSLKTALAVRGDGPLEQPARPRAPARAAAGTARRRARRAQVRLPDVVGMAWDIRTTPSRRATTGRPGRGGRRRRGGVGSGSAAVGRAARRPGRSGSGRDCGEAAVRGEGGGRLLRGRPG